jgi:hypothetical protein
MTYPLLFAQRQRLVASMTRRAAAMRCFSTKPQEMESFLSGTSGVYAEQMHDNYLEDPNSVHPSWKKYFDNLAQGVAFDAEQFSRPSLIPGKRAAVASGVSSYFGWAGTLWRTILCFDDFLIPLFARLRTLSRPIL